MASFYVEDTVALKENESITAVVEVRLLVRNDHRFVLDLTLSSKPGVMYAPVS